MHAVFAHLDPAGTGFIPPEGYSRLLDDMGYPLQENICASQLAISKPVIYVSYV
jgi:hypothetical protein